MQSHDDRDMPRGDLLRKLFGDATIDDPRKGFHRQLEERAVEMSNSRLNEITAGRDGERVLLERQVGRVLVRQLPDDDLGILRISIGGGEKLHGYYLVYRGDREAIREALRHALRAIDRADR